MKIDHYFSAENMRCNKCSQSTDYGTILIDSEVKQVVHLCPQCADDEEISGKDDSDLDRGIEV